MKVSPTVEEVLSLLGDGTLLRAEAIGHRGPELVAPLPRKFRNFERRRLTQLITRLWKSGSLEVRADSSGHRIELSGRGEEHLRRLQLKRTAVSPTQDWDGYWRMISYDIPEKHKSAREALRRHLKRLGFYPLRSGVWILPYPCFDEVVELVQALGIESYVTLIEGAIGRDARLKYHFRLR